MSIVAKKRGGAGTWGGARESGQVTRDGAFTRGGARESGQKGGARESGWETRWKRVVPLAVLLALAAVVAWRLADARKRVPPAAGNVAVAAPGKGAAGRPEAAPYHGGDAGAQKRVPAATPASERAVAHSESSPRLAGNVDAATPAADETPAAPEPSDEKPPKHFPRETEQLLAIMLSTPPDTEMPPLPHLDPEDERLNADALLALTNSLVIYETDDERVAALKEAVAELKVQLAEAVRNGGSVADVLNEFRDWQNEGVEMRNETIRAIGEVEDDAEAAKALEAANRELEAEGVVPIRPEEVGFESAEEE